MLWSIVAYGFVPLGLITCAMLLSGITQLEALAAYVSSFGIQAGSIRLQIDKLCVLIASALFLSEAMRVETAHEAEERQVSSTLQDRARMNRWRHERNYWISLYMLTLWSVAWRVARIIELKRGIAADKITPNPISSSAAGKASVMSKTDKKKD